MTDRIAELVEKINRERNNYYNGEAQIPDKVYDAWIDELAELDPKNFAVIGVGAPTLPSEWKKAKHSIPMGSLDKVNLPEELLDWSKNKNCNRWFVTEKLDGLSIEVVYEHGKITQCITRGDGVIGDEIGINVVRMNGVKSDLGIDFNGSIRGEIIMLNSVHQKCFAEMKSARNAAAGVCKRLDGVDVDKLNVIFYQALGDVDFTTEKEQFDWLKSRGLDTPNYWLFNGIDEVNDHWRAYQDSERAKLDYSIDGLVVRIDDMDKQVSFGEKDLRPLGATAFKFDNEGAETVILEVQWQTGASGRITPVAIIEPVVLVDAKITRASMYNMAYINELGLDIGATVLVVRANDVIPRIEELIKGTGTVMEAPEFCPDCGSPTEMDGENLVCRNADGCRSQIVGRIANWVSELNLLEWGTSLLEKLVDSGKVSTVADLYTLTVSDLASLDRMGKKSAQKCYDILHTNMEVDLAVFLGGLSIPLIGQSTIKLVMAAGYDTLEKISQCSIANFENISGLGPVKAASLFDGLKNNVQLIDTILNNGVKIKEKIMGNLNGSTFVFTGAMENKRADLEKMVLDNGGMVKGSVTRGVNFLVMADPSSQSSKAINARKLGTALISEQEFLAMLQ